MTVVSARFDERFPQVPGRTVSIQKVFHLEWLTIAWMRSRPSARHVRNRLRLVVAFSRSEIFLQTSEPDGCVRLIAMAHRHRIDLSSKDSASTISDTCGNRTLEERTQSTERWKTACVACQDQSVEKRHHRAATIG